MPAPARNMGHFCAQALALVCLFLPAARPDDASAAPVNLDLHVVLASSVGDAKVHIYHEESTTKNFEFLVELGPGLAITLPIPATARSFVRSTGRNNSSRRASRKR